MDNGKKNALKILTTNDIRKHAREWTLAGDVGLLAHLEQFSESIINKTQETQSNFNELVDDYEELHTKVGNITNQFLALQNCQFVENRVYDEETPTEEKPEVKEQNEADQEKLLLTQYKEAVEVGIKLLDTHFQEFQLPPNSDSDEEDEVSPGNSIIWKPKNPYAGKKFPFLIGSSEWWADDNVGLRPNKDNQDTEKIVSESESDMESLKSVEKTMKSSSSPSSSSSSMENIKSIPVKPVFMESTEDLFGFEKNSGELSKGSNSLAGETGNFQPEEPETDEKKGEPSVEDKQSEERQNQSEIEPSKPKKLDNEFTRELMAKLVSVTNKTENGVPEKTEKVGKVEKTGKVEKAGKVEEVEKARGRPEESLFDDETDDGSDLFSGKVARSKERDAGGSKGLFFDAENDDELFKGENDLFSGSTLFEGDVFKKEIQQSTGKIESEGRGGDSPVKPTERKEGSPPKRNLVNDLFDDLDDDEDTLFAAKPAKEKKSPEKSSVPMEKESREEVKKPVLDWDDDDGGGLFESAVAGVDDDDLFSSAGLFDAGVNKLDDKAKETKPDVPSKESQTVIKPDVRVEEATKKPPVVDSNVRSTKKQTLDDPFGFSSAKKDTAFKKISILDSDEEDDLFSKCFADEKKPKAASTSASASAAAIDGDGEDDDDSALFAADKPKPPDSVSVSSSRSSLFDDVSASKSRLASVFEKDKAAKNEESLANDGRKDLFGGKSREGRISLFDDCGDDDDDDLFGAGTKPTTARASLFEKPTVDTGKTEKKDDPEENDLFKASGTPAKVRTAKSDILRHSEEALFADDPLDADLFAEKSAKPKPPSSLSLKPAEPEAKGGQTVGKLNIPDNLKVKFESVAKKISPGGATKPPAVEKKQEEKREEILDEPLQSSALLKCPSKDRVKIPGRRRPQSRRARQEAIRNSGNWDQPLPTSSSSLKGSSPVVSNPLSPSTDEEDFFKVPELDTNFEKEDQSIFKSDLFESSKSSKPDDGLLFDGAPVLSPLGPRKAEQPVEEPAATTTPETETLFGSGKRKIVSIFDDDDDDDDLNGEDDESLFKSSKPRGRDPDKSGEVLKKPLFDPDLEDDDDEDDLFGGKSQAPPSKLPPAEKRKEGGGEPKEKGNSSFVDPLGLMTKDE